MVSHRAQFRSAFLTVLLTTFAWPPALAEAAVVTESWESLLRRSRETPISTALAPQQPEVRYTAAQIEAISRRARNAWRSYVHLRPQLGAGDSHEQALVRRAVVLRARARAVERLLADEKRQPTKEGPQTIALALTSLDRATAVVEYDLDRIALRIAQEALLPANQPFCVCVAPASARIPPAGPTPCQPATEASLTLAAGEAEGFQLVVVPYWKWLKGVRVEVGDLFRRDAIDRLRPDQVRLWLAASAASRPTLGREILWPDPLTPARPFDLPATASQAILVDIGARRDQPPGLYEGHLTVKANNLRPMTISLRILIRAFTLPDDRPKVVFRAKNDFLQTRLAAPPPSHLVQTWERFLAPLALGLYRQSDPANSTAQWLPLQGAYGLLPAETLSADPYSPAAPTALAYRQAGWAAWEADRRGKSKAQHRLVSGWVSLGPSAPVSAESSLVPIVRTRWSPEKRINPPGLIYLNHLGKPEPTLRLLALRDGIEDYRYLELLAHHLTEANRLKTAGWWKRRKWKRLLRIDPKLCDPTQNSLELASKLLRRRDAIADAIEEIRRRRHTNPHTTNNSSARSITSSQQQ